MIDDNMISVAVPHITGSNYYAIRGSINRRALRGCKIKPCMELGGLVNRIDTITITGGDTFQIFITYRLYGRCMSKQLFLIFYQLIYLVIGFFLSFYPAGQVL